MADLFTNPADGLLYNNVRATTEKGLDRLEADLSIKRMMLIRAQVGLPEPRQPVEAIIGPAYAIPPIPLRFDEQHLRALHRYLFQDVYPWAGETRQDRAFQGYKPALNVQADLMMTYTNHRRITTDAAAITAQLTAENNLKGLSKAQFVERAAYYLDHLNHVHVFREGNGRTMQFMMMQLGHQAGYRVDFEKVYKDFNLARDTGIVGVSVNTAENRTRLRYLLDAASTELPGAAAKAARHPSQARPLGAATLEVARLEALRELKASSQRVGIRYAQETGAPLNDAGGNTIMSPLLMYVQALVMARPAALTEQATLDELQKPYVVIAASPTAQLSDKAMLLRYSQAVGQAVQVFRPQLTQQPGLPAQQTMPQNEPRGRMPYLIHPLPNNKKPPSRSAEGPN
ncbi:Fic/DOC family protein [Hymenobacter humi]|uniref:protein adenylyltransferase n=1 Tax=Hymenobacter humi TaxID=1411620 RepID=A0ABW2UDS1_9BACT